jgi:hypothetical protein
MSFSNDSSQPPTNILRRTDFDKQLTQAVMERVVKQTIALVAEVERKTPWRDHEGPDDRLHTAILKTLDGSRRWDPARVELGGHLFGIVSSQISHELDRGVKLKHLSLEDDEHQNLEALQHETEDALARSTPATDEAPISPVWTLAMQALREVASGERDVLAILDAYDQGAFTKRDVMRVAKLKRKACDAAYARLVELAMEVDEETRDIILQAIA